MANPFSRIKARSLVLWAVVSGLAFGIALGVSLAALTEPEDDADPFFGILALFAWFYGFLSIWGLWKAFRNRVDFGRLLGRMPAGYGWLPLLGTVPLLLGFSLSHFSVILYWVARKAPDLTNPLLAGPDVVAKEGFTNYPILYTTTMIVVVVLVAPVVEEFVFRGLLLTRWSLKWGTRVGVVVSALVFAILHGGNVLGMFFFGVVMALLYLRSGTLFVPIVAHALNNLLGVVLSLPALPTAFGETGSLVDELRPIVGMLSIVALATGAALIWYIVRNWPKRGSLVPYLTIKSQEPQASPS